MQTAIILFSLITVAFADGPCKKEEFGRRGCDSKDTLWQCDGTNWVPTNYCGQVNMRCIAVDNKVESAGCSPKPPAGQVECTNEQYGSYRCDGSKLQQCAFDPWWVTTKTCSASEICVAAGNYIGCVPVALAASLNNANAPASKPAAAASPSAVAKQQDVAAPPAPASAPASGVSAAAIAGASAAVVAVVAVAGALVYKQKMAASASASTLAPSEGLLTA